MILADTLKTLTTFTAPALTRAVGRQGIRFASARFLGMTNGGQFCYSVTDTDNGQGKVFLSYDPTAGRVIADMD